MMKELIEGFSAQLLESIKIANSATLAQPSAPIQNVVIAGMGGSGIGGTLIKALTNDEVKVPIDVSKSYDVPAYINQNTLFIACSFSGNTEETLAAADKAKAKGAQIVAITSGGKMGAFVAANGYSSITIPGRSNSPRASIGYSFVQIFHILNHYGLIPSRHFEEIEASAKNLTDNSAEIQKISKELTAYFKDKLPILYGDSKVEAVLIRSQQQIAENSKHLSHVNVFPEMNHNELVGWKYPNVVFSNASTVLVRTSFDHPRTSVRLDVCKDIFTKVAGSVYELHAKGNSFIEQSIYLINVLDWTSFHLAEANNVDPFPVDVINFLKDELAKVGYSVVPVKFADLGRRPYQEIWDFQEDCLQKVISQKIASRTDPDIHPDLFLFFVEHDPVFTLGKSGKEDHLLVDQTELKTRGVDYHKINRGGDITFHGHGQIVGYPIWDLDQIYTDIHRYLREIEEVVILTLQDFGISNAGRSEGLTGVWVGEEKICAIGVRTSRWVTMHGFALNVNTDLSYFNLIVPCGIQDKAVTSMEKILGYRLHPEDVKASLKQNFEKVFPIMLQAYEV